MSTQPVSLPGLPGGAPQLEQYLERHALPDAGRDAVREALTGNPVRRVGGGGSNVAVRYASQKMGCVVQAESRTVELAFVENCEYDPEVVFFLCQPLTLHVSIVDSLGRRRLVRHTPDYLVLDAAGFSLVECKPLSVLRRDAEKEFPRFRCEGSDWSWPAATDAARALGLGYRVFTSSDVNSFWIRNMRFLADFTDETSADFPDGPPPPSDAARLLLDRVSQAGSVPVAELLDDDTLRPEVLWRLVAHRRLFADLRRELVFGSATAQVHASERRMIAARHLKPVADLAPADLHTLSIAPCATLSWDGQPWIVLNRGDAHVTLRHDADGQVVSVPTEDFHRLLVTGAFTQPDSDSGDPRRRLRDEIWRRAGDEHIAAAERCYDIIQAAQRTGTVPKGTSERSVFRYRSRYAEGEQKFGDGFTGLIRFLGRRPRDAGPRPCAAGSTAGGRRGVRHRHQGGSAECRLRPALCYLGQAPSQAGLQSRDVPACRQPPPSRRQGSQARGCPRCLPASGAPAGVRIGTSRACGSGLPGRAR